MKKLEIEKTKPTFIISFLKVEYKVVLIASISNCSINKMSLANKWMKKKIPPEIQILDFVYFLPSFLGFYKFGGYNNVLIRKITHNSSNIENSF